MANSVLEDWIPLKRNPENGRLIRSFLKTKLARYEGKRRSILKWRQNQPFLIEADGDRQLAGFIFQHRDNLILTKLLNELDLSDLQLNASYFCSVFEQVLEISKQKNQFKEVFGLLSDFLLRTSDGIIRKRIIPQIILEVEEDGNAYLQGKVKELAIRAIGDPVNDGLWAAWPEATEAERSRLRTSQEIINRWINKEFIRIFFDKITMDPERERFWMSYTDSITRIYVYGPAMERDRLFQDDRIKTYLKERFRLLERDYEGSALILIIKDFILIESTEVGAVYCYQRFNPFIQKVLNNDSIKSINELKDSSFVRNRILACNRSFNTRTEGRIMHRGPNWPNRIEFWLRKYPQIQKNKRW